MQQITIFDTTNFKLTACDDGQRATYMLTFKDCRDALLIGEQDIPVFEGIMRDAATLIGQSATVDDVLGHAWVTYVPITVQESGDVRGR